MENEITNAGIEMDTKLNITADGNSYLRTTAQWATFMAILGFIGTVLLVVVAFFMMIISPMSSLGSTFGFPMSLIGVLYLLMAVLYFFPAYYLYSFADKAKQALDGNKQELFDESLKNLKRMFKFLGIMTIVLISAYLIAIPTIFVLRMVH